MKNEIKLSVVICAYTMKRWDDLREAILSVEAGHVDGVEIILVCDNNRELLEKATTAYPGVKVIANAFAPGLSGARNTGIDVSRGQFVAFLDDDATASPSWVSAYARYFTDPDVIGVMPRVDPEWLAPKPGWFPEEFRWSIGATHPDAPDTVTRVRNLFGGAMCVRRDVFVKVGGFDSTLGRTTGLLPISCEETEFCLRAAHALPKGYFVYDPDMQIQHKVTASRLTWKYFILRCTAEGISKARLSRIVRQTAALSDEKRFVVKTLTAGCGKALADTVVRGDIHGLSRIAAMVIGIGVAGVGYVAGLVLPLPDRGTPPTFSLRDLSLASLRVSEKQGL